MFQRSVRMVCLVLCTPMWNACEISGRNVNGGYLLLKITKQSMLDEIDRKNYTDLTTVIFSGSIV